MRGRGAAGAPTAATHTPHPSSCMVDDGIILSQHQTPDMGGQATTTDVVQAIIEDIKPKTQTRSVLSAV